MGHPRSDLVSEPHLRDGYRVGRGRIPVVLPADPRRRTIGRTGAGRMLRRWHRGVGPGHHRRDRQLRLPPVLGARAAGTAAPVCGAVLPRAGQADHAGTRRVGPGRLYLTPWYTAALQNEWIGAFTRIILVVIGFGYFYARLQADPVPRKYPQLISLLITVVETLGDGVLGLVIWQGSLIAAEYFSALQRSLR